MLVLARILSTKAREQLKEVNWERRIKRCGKEKVYLCMFHAAPWAAETHHAAFDRSCWCVRGWVGVCM